MIFKTKQGWHSWFAWYPVRLDGADGENYQALVWLQIIERYRPSYKYPWSYKL